MKLSGQPPTIDQVIQSLQIGNEYFWEPARIAQPGAWTGHLTTAFWLVKVVQPSILVELGTHSGNSYAAFCQAISQLDLPSRAFAVDTWKGDDQAGFYDETIFHDLDAFNQNHFGRFSRLVRSTFDDARPHFADGSIDLLHIDGLHTYDAVKHDFDTWKTAASPSAVVVFHDINVRQGEFGVWKLWRQLSEDYPSFEFHHSEGLGILGLGPNQCPALTRLFEFGRVPEAALAVRQLFAARGEAFLSRARNLDLEYLVSVHSERATDLDSTRHHLAHLQANLEAIQPELDRLRQVEAAARDQADEVRRIINEAATDRAEAAERRRACEALDHQVRGLHEENASLTESLKAEREALDHQVRGLHEENATLTEALKTERELASSLQSRLEVSASLARQQSLTVQRNLFELQSARQALEKQKRDFDDCKQELEAHKMAYVEVAGLLISPRMRGIVPRPLREPLRALKRALRSMVHQST